MNPARNRRWHAMAALLTANFMNVLDVSIVNLGLPDLQRELGASPRDLQWIVIVYILTYGLGLLPFGRMGDIVGRRRMVLAGMIAFIATSAACGAAPSIGMLVLMRGLQGLSAAMMSSQVMAIAQTMFSGPERAKVASLFGLSAGLSGIAGPIIAGLLLHADAFGLGWRLLYLINIPIGVAALSAAFAWVPVCPPEQALRNDRIGILLSSAAILCLFYPLAQGRAAGSTLSGGIAIALGITLLMLFVWWQRRQERVGGPVLLPPYLLAKRDYAMGALGIFVFFTSMQGFFLVLSLYLQQGQGFSALQAGMTNTPFPVGIILATALGNRIGSPRFRLFMGIAGLVCVFLAIRGVVMMSAGSHMNPFHFAIQMSVFGFAAGLCISSLFQIVMMTVPLRDAGAGMAAIQVVQQIGGGAGIAIASTIFFMGLHPGHAAGTVAYDKAFFDVTSYQIVTYLMVAAIALTMKFEVRAAPRRPAPIAPTKK